LAVARNQPCTFSCYLRQEGIREPVQVRVHHEGRDYAECSFTPGDTWKKYSARLAFRSDDPNATLSITFHGPGTLWLDNASLMPENTIGGWRPDVVEAVRALKPGVIRFGGSALDDRNLGEFDWRDSVGDPDHRKPFRAWGGLQPTGPGLEEIVQFCHHVGAEPLICVRVSGRNPEDARDEVQYFNGATDTPMGQLRAKNGHPASYAIKYWQVGNERAGAEYEARLPVFCKAMKEADPSVQLFSSSALFELSLSRSAPTGKRLSGLHLPAPLRLRRPGRQGEGPGEHSGHAATSCPGQVHQGRGHRVEHDRRRLGPAPGHALDPRQRSGLLTLPQLDAPPR
jgi:alpha-N-arabinofuranosidase